MLFHCILANERPSGSNLQLMLVLDPQVKSLNKAMTTSVCFFLPSILVSPGRTFDFPCFLSDVVFIQEAKGFIHIVGW